MRYTLIATLSASMLVLGACQHKDSTATNDTSTTTMVDNNAVMTNDNAPAPAMPAMSGQTFANTAAASDAFEIATSKLAATNGASSGVQTFATKMIDAHTGSTTKLKGVTASLTPKITPDPTMSSEQQQTLGRLKVIRGAEFDKEYAAAQVTAHQQTLDALKSYAANGDVAALKSFATDLVPTVTDHLNMAKALNP